MGKRKKCSTVSSAIIDGNRNKVKNAVLAKIRILNKKTEGFVIGCNAVIRCLERNEFSFVAVSKDIPSLLLHTISSLVKHNGTLLFILSTSEIMDLNFKIKRITAFGIKKIMLDESRELEELFKEIMKVKSKVSCKLQSASVNTDIKVESSYDLSYNDSSEDANSFMPYRKVKKVCANESYISIESSTEQWKFQNHTNYPSYLEIKVSDVHLFNNLSS